MIIQTQADIMQNPLVKRALKHLGLKPAPQLMRSRIPWQEKILSERAILVGGSGNSLRYIEPWLRKSGAVFFLSPQTSDQVFDEIMHRRLNNLDEIEERTAVHGVIYDASPFSKPSDLREIYQFFNELLNITSTPSRIVIISRDKELSQDSETRATLAAIEGFSRSLAKELARFGSTVQNLQLASQAETRSGPFVQYFLSDYCSYITGQVVKISNQTQGIIKHQLAGSLAGRSALVTGAAGDLGQAICRSLASEGVHVYCLDVAEVKDELLSLAKQIDGSAILKSLTDEDASYYVSQRIKQESNYCDIIVHNAGITKDRSLKHMELKNWDRVIETNLTAPLKLNEAIDQAGLLREGGSLIAISSISGIAGNFGQTNYSASKAGLIGMTKALAARYADRGISCNAIAPGFIETKMTAKMPFLAKQIARRMSSLAQGGLPEDVADAVCFLASPCSRGFSGQTLRVCGGHILGA